jgi:transposase-like protein
MGALKFRCPKKLLDVRTSIETDDATLHAMRRMKFSLWCPYCQLSHEVLATETFVADMSGAASPAA